VEEGTRGGPFVANWVSLGAYRVPKWFRDAKFGIFIHWGVYSVPAFGNEWYSRNMYQSGSPAFKHHVEIYGPQSVFGYKDFIPLFRAENFDADAWVDLFARAGARYIVPVAEHCDGFAMYESAITGWNAAKMGPKRDILAEISVATRKRGLRFGASSHRAEHWWWYDGGMRFDSDVQNPSSAAFYGPARPMALVGDDEIKEPNPEHLERWLAPDAKFMDDWLARSTEIVDKYHPDFLYFDWWIGQPAFQPYLKRFAAYFYNQAARRKQDVVLTYKQNDFPENAAVLDIERGKLDSLRLLPWQTDTSVSIHSWGYVKNDEYRDAKSLIEWELALERWPQSRWNDSRRGPHGLIANGLLASGQRRSDLWLAAVGALWRRSDHGCQQRGEYGSSGIYAPGCSLHDAKRRALCYCTGLAHER